MHALLLVGTKRGLFIFESAADRSSWRARGPYLVGREIYHALIDERDRSLWAATDHAVWGAHVHRSTDLGENWETLENAPHYLDERGLKAIWFLAPGHVNTPQRFYAGIEPAGLFVSNDGCASWHSVVTLNDHPTNQTWQPAGGGLQVVIDIPLVEVEELETTGSGLERESRTLNVEPRTSNLEPVEMEESA